MLNIVFFGYGNSARATVDFLQRVKKGDVNHAGVWHDRVAGFSVRDVEVAACFEIDKSKSGKDVSVKILPGIIKDEIPRHIESRSLMHWSEEEVMKSLKQIKPDVAFNVISSGQDNASKAYAKMCAELGIPFANATPASIATDSYFRSIFAERKTPLAGDDLMSQLGGTVLHKGIIDFLDSRGIKAVRSYQLDVGGSPDTLNTIKDDIRSQKRRIKSSSIAGEVDYKVDAVAGTTDYVEFLGSRRTIYFWIEGRGPLDEPYEIDIFFKSSDPANAVNIIIDVARALAKAKIEGKGGLEEIISAYGFKNPGRRVKQRSALAEFEQTYVG
ncbi:MAG: hypothetical protein QXG05_06870 [Nitrososphaerota archaeon]